MCHARHHGTELFLIVSVVQCVSFTALWYWTFFCVQTYAGISVVKYCYTCDLQPHGTDLFGPFLWYFPYKNEITRVIHSIMVLSFFGLFMWDFPYKKMK